MAIKFEDIGSWEEKLPSAAKLPSATKLPSIANMPSEEPIKSKVDFSSLLMAGCVGFLLGVLTFYAETKINFGGGGGGDQENVVPDGDKQVSSRDMVFIREVADVGADTQELDRLWDRVKLYCVDKGSKCRRYDKDQKSAERYVEYAKSKNVSAPFVAFSKDGSITGVKTVKEMEAVLK